MTRETVTLAGLPISRLALDAALDRCRAHAARGEGGFACFVNVHTLTEATRNAPLRAALTAASYRFPDGVPLLWLARAKRSPIAGRVCGPDFMAAMLRLEPARTHGLIGGAPGIGEALAARHGVRTVTYSPPLRPYSHGDALHDWRTFLERCPERTPPPIVWVGLGAPKQELWLATVSAEAPGVMFYGVGAAFDFLAGAKRRAPRMLQRLGLEWAYRLGSEPRRLLTRYLVSNARFAIVAARELRDRDNTDAAGDT